ncbi:MAG: tRNA 4-thiouridine(8) synthase ThiI [Ruminococcaceae bacterium]|nr:tRNA 4-thiouridine(8) synthase ThiI [Oscillospiraceae bacterium]
MERIILLKLGEIALKGLNRRSFEEKLMSNIRRRISAFGNFNLRSAQSTIYIRCTAGEEDAIDRAFEACKDIFGIVSLSLAAECEKNYASIRETALAFLGNSLSFAQSFKVDAKRSDKRFPMNSPEIMRTLGGDILSKYPHLEVDVHNPEMTVTVEVRDFAAYVHGEKVPGAGGMPVGSAGRGTLLLSGGIDSPVAAWMMGKRGLEMIAVHFESPPYTSQRAREKVLTLAGKLTRYTGRMRVFVVPFTEAQLAIRDNCPEDLFTLIMRRMMMECACRLSEKYDSHAIITGESLGQVASQTLGALGVTEALATLPVLRPLIGMDKEEIVQISRKIDTYETSILPYEDCCTVFTPKHPRLRPRMADLEEAEAHLNKDALIEACLAGATEYEPLYD